MVVLFFILSRIWHSRALHPIFWALPTSQFLFPNVLLTLEVVLAMSYIGQSLSQALILSILDSHESELTIIQFKTRFSD